MPRLPRTNQEWNQLEPPTAHELRDHLPPTLAAPGGYPPPTGAPGEALSEQALQDWNDLQRRLMTNMLRHANPREERRDKQRVVAMAFCVVFLLGLTIGIVAVTQIDAYRRGPEGTRPPAATTDRR